MNYFMGIDVGTYESKGVLINETCEIVASHAVQHGLENPKEGYYEHDAEEVWWKDVCKISKNLIEKSRVNPEQIKLIGTSALGADLVPVDEKCKPLRKAILYGIDSRAVEEMKIITELYGEEKVKKVFGRPLCSSDIIPKILWLKNNEPLIHKNAHKLLTASSFITAKLTGVYVVDRFLGQSSFAPLYHKDGLPNIEECEFFCRPNQLANCRPSTDVVGNITEKASEETGLLVGTPVLTGTDDSGAEAISTGVLSPGDLMIQFGSSLYFVYCSDKLVHDDRIWSEEFIIPNTFSVTAGTNAAGTLTRWYRDNIYFDKLKVEEQQGINAYTQMLDGLEDIEVGSGGLITLPYLAGERTPIHDPNAKGIIFGLKLSHTREHLYKSALESIGYTIAQHLKIFRENELKINKIMLVGGGTKNKVCMQIISDITGEEIKTAKVTIGASYGDAIMAALAYEVFEDFSDFSSIIQLGDIYHPDLKNHIKYQKYQTLYEEIYEATKSIMHQL